MQQTALASLLLGAGAGLVSAAPAPWWWKEPKHHHFSSFPGSGSGFGGSAGASLVPSAAATGGFASYSIPAGSGIAVPTGKTNIAATGSGVAFPTGTAAYSSAAYSTGTAVAASSVAASTSSSSSASGASSGEVSNASASSSCTFTSASDAISGKKDCTAIVLSGIAVPAGTTLDMTDLSDGTTVTFEGTTTFAYEEWDGPLISFSGTDITVQGASGHLINMGGENWWDGEGSNGGKTKPKGFYAHDLTDSTITGLNIKNTPIQCFSVDNASNLKFVDITIDDSEGDGDDGGHNTDAWDVGSSTGVYISGANVKNQDDCLAINSGTDISFTGGTCSGGHGLSIGSVGGRDDNTVENVYIVSISMSTAKILSSESNSLTIRSGRLHHHRLRERCTH